ncbi:MAG: restriction endonuclease subunit S, partial [Desulfobacteraceae bacterium]|nr:restriction endonuclease subunit S [Desulfobacteraceae bacterium]
MVSNWPEIPVADVCNIFLGGTPKRSDPTYWGGSIKWASARDVANCQTRYLTSTNETITQKGIEESAAMLLEENTIVITARGTVGALCMLGEPMSFNQTCYGLVGKQAISSQYLYYALKAAISQIRSISYGTVFDTITMKSFKNLMVPLPSPEQQRAIAHILGSLDDKIELNLRMNEVLEAMARAIFKSWFVDFDPVRARVEGRDLSLPNEIAALFPDSFQDSDLGKIPKGWKVSSLSEVITLIGGGTPKTKVQKYWGGNIPWFSVVDAPRDTDVFVIDTKKYISQLGVDNSSTNVLRKGTTIISARGTVGKCALVGRPIAMNQSCYGIQGKGGIGDYFVYFTIRRQVADLQRSGHGSVFNTITRDTFKTIRISFPPTNLTNSYE